MKVLIIDDDASIRRLYSEELQDEGYEVVVASSGQKALPVLEHSEPDVVVLDILMPGMDGVQILKTIRDNMPRIPVIISSAYDYYDDAMVYSPDSYILKSSDTTELKNAIKNLFTQ